MNGGRSFNTHRIVCIYSFAVNPVRNSSGALNPAFRGGTRYGVEPGIILKSNPAAASGPEGAEGHYF
jgi:hypothetical protein